MTEIELMLTIISHSMTLNLGSSDIVPLPESALTNEIKYQVINQQGFANGG